MDSTSAPITTALVVAGISMLLVGAALGLGSRWLLRGRSSLSASGAVLAGVVGAVLGGAVTQVAMGNPSTPHVGFLALFSVLGTVLVLVVTERLVGGKAPDATALVEAGESATVEFKSTARHNLHSGKRDERMEAVITKTLAGFLNARGGTLLIGVDDEGHALGLDDDLQYMKAPDLDRYELWLHDHLTRALGAPAVALLRVTFPVVHGRAICRVDATPSPRPVFARGKGEQVVFYARLGNSTRELGVADAIDYAADHFGRRGWMRRKAG
ncbi:ATP-binding protein [Actinotalea sp. M2MS4P-6]|uniref:ATP-binding protein n=1 Tax=Actinotalea sp. M2MS4P-6 TaxID=2983762 RepID=UPI0021E4D135|nr:ATP-binding protein [Actinotalea sp. M2MS4P-6]MCV2394503.1 ATP-binding protein [Actinotalea sp. M2MS4P-6]